MKGPKLAGKFLLLIFLITFVGRSSSWGSKQVKSQDQFGSCEQSLKSYKSQRSGSDPQLVHLARSLRSKLKHDLIDSELGRGVAALIRSKPPERIVERTWQVLQGATLNLETDRDQFHWKLILTDPSKDSRREILSSKSLSKKVGNAVFEKIAVSPDLNLIAVQVAIVGSIDSSQIIIIDLRSFEQIAKLDASYSFSWVADSRLLFEKPWKDDSGVREVKIYDVRDQQIYNWSHRGQIWSSANTWTLAIRNNQKVLLHRGSEYPLPDTQNYFQIIGTYQGRLIYSQSGVDNGSPAKIFSLGIESVENGTFDDVTTLVFGNSYCLGKARIVGDYLLLERSQGEKFELVVYQMDGSFVAVVPLEMGPIVKSIFWENQSRVFVIQLQNPIHESVEVRYSPENKKFLDPIEEILMRDSNGNVYEQTVARVLSEDGTEIPFRLFYKKGQVRKLRSGRLTSANPLPVLIDSYGGFEASGFFRMDYNRMNQEFLSRGGVLVGPALRGGNEFGREWHLSGTNVAKQNTFKDLIAVSEGLIQLKLTEPDKIVSLGGSNGGLVVAAAAGARPDLFGLVIPINGVLDWENTDKLDKSFGGWVWEYGSIHEPQVAWMRSEYSPVSKAKSGSYPNVLVVTGLNDSRVHPLNSFHFVHALQSAQSYQGELHWLAIKNAGHHSRKFSRNGAFASYVEAAIWTAIFKQVGFTP